MAEIVANANVAGFPALFSVRAAEKVENYEQVYEANRHRIYSLAFWMTGSEPLAEEVSTGTFRRAFGFFDSPSADAIDCALLRELRDYAIFGTLTLNCAPATEVASVRRNTLRVHLEQAILQLPSTERLCFCLHDGEGYSHTRISALLGIATEESQMAVHQARLRIRELVATMN